MILPEDMPAGTCGIMPLIVRARPKADDAFRVTRR
jgi:hypothetical protein